MLRPRRQYRILQAAFLFALVGIAFFGAYAGYRAGEYPAYEHTRPHGGEQDILSALWHWATHDAAGFFTIILCVITGALAWVTYGLYSATVALASDTKEASAQALTASTRATTLAAKEFVSTHRPRLRVRKVAIWKLNDGQSIVAQAEIVNVGNTEAILRSVMLRVEVPRNRADVMYNRPESPWHGEDTHNYDPPKVLVSGQVEPATITTDLIYKFNDHRFSVEQMIVRGTVIYDDAMGFQRHTEIERVYLWQADRTMGHRFAKREKPDPDTEYED